MKLRPVSLISSLSCLFCHKRGGNSRTASVLRKIVSHLLRRKWYDKTLACSEESHPAVKPCINPAQGLWRSDYSFRHSISHKMKALLGSFNLYLTGRFPDSRIHAQRAFSYVRTYNGICISLPVYSDRIVQASHLVPSQTS